MSAPNEIIWAVCRCIRLKACKSCPPRVDTAYGPGKQACRLLAEQATNVVWNAAIEAAAAAADREAGDWRDDTREHWAQGFQDGAMEVASAIRELKATP